MEWGILMAITEDMIDFEHFTAKDASTKNLHEDPDRNFV